jgi:hypothetical protein
MWSHASLMVRAKTVGPSPSICSLNRMPGRALASTTEQGYVTAGGKPYVASAVQAMLAR